VAVRALAEHPGQAPLPIGVVAFSGMVDRQTGRPVGARTADAHLVSGVTRERSRIAAALDSIGARGPMGATNFEAGLVLAMRALADPEAAGVTAPDSGAILLVTDGVPTLPHGRGNVVDDGDVAAAQRAVLAARRRGIAVHGAVFGLGQEPDAFVREPMACVGGRKVVVRADAGDLTGLLPTIFEAPPR
jgi:hypothetical protein